MYNAAKTERKHIHIWFWPEAAAGYFIFDVYVVASFLSLEVGYIRTFSLNHPGDPFFQGGSQPRVWKPLLYNRRTHHWFWMTLRWRLTDSFMRILNSLIYRATKFLFFLTAQSCLPFLFTLSFFFPPSKPFGSHKNFSFACLSTIIVARLKQASAISVFERVTRCRVLREFGDVVFWI